MPTIIPIIAVTPEDVVPVDAPVITVAPDGDLTGERYLAAGNGLQLVDSGANNAMVYSLTDTAVTPGSYTTTSLTVDAQGRITSASSGAGSGAPSTATYITQTSDSGLSAEQALGDLATGLLKSTTTTGVLSIASAGTDFVAPATTITAGSGLDGGGALSANITLNIGAGSGILLDTDVIHMNNTAVVPASYTSPTITVDAQGRITAARSVAEPKVDPLVYYTTASELAEDLTIGWRISCYATATATGIRYNGVAGRTYRLALWTSAGSLIEACAATPVVGGIATCTFTTPRTVTERTYVVVSAYDEAGASGHYWNAADNANVAPTISAVIQTYWNMPGCYISAGVFSAGNAFPSTTTAVRWGLQLITTCP